MPDVAVEFAEQLRLAGVPRPQREYRFAAVHVGGTGKGVRARLEIAGLSDWRFDVAWPEQRIAVEVDGGGFVGGRHSRGLGIEADCAKVSTAAALGWRVLRVTPRQVRKGQALAWVEQALGIQADKQELWRRIV